MTNLDFKIIKGKNILGNSDNEQRLSDINDVRLSLRVVVKHLKCTQYGEAGEKGNL